MNPDEHRKGERRLEFRDPLAMATKLKKVWPCLCSSVFICVPALFLCSCAIGPNYSKPPVDVPAQWKEAGDWVVAQPKDAAPKGKWWEAFNDPVLNGLEEQVEVSNQTLAAAEARYRQARAAVQSARSQLFPIFSGSGGGTRNRAGTSQVDSAGLVIG